MEREHVNKDIEENVVAPTYRVHLNCLFFFSIVAISIQKKKSKTNVERTSVVAVVIVAVSAFVQGLVPLRNVLK